MKKLTSALILAVFAFNCWFAWAMLTLFLDVRNAGKALPDFTNLCISLRPLLVALPFVAAAYGLWLSRRKPDNVRAWAGLLVIMMIVLIVFVFPATLTSLWLVIELKKAAIG
jgi:hypothetical protein